MNSRIVCWTQYALLAQNIKKQSISPAERLTWPKSRINATAALQYALYSEVELCRRYLVDYEESMHNIVKF